MTRNPLAVRVDIFAMIDCCPPARGHWLLRSVGGITHLMVSQPISVPKNLVRKDPYGEPC